MSDLIDQDAEAGLFVYIDVYQRIVCDFPVVVTVFDIDIHVVLRRVVIDV